MLTTSYASYFMCLYDIQGEGAYNSVLNECLYAMIPSITVRVVIPISDLISDLQCSR